MGKYLIKVFDKNNNEIKVIDTFIKEISLRRTLNQVSELTFSLDYRDNNLFDAEGNIVLKYNTKLQLLRVRNDGEVIDKGFFYIKDRELQENILTFKAYGALVRLKDFLLPPNFNFKEYTLDVAIKRCLLKHSILRTWTWNQDWKNVARIYDLDYEILKGEEYGDAVILASDDIADVKVFKEEGYLITEPIDVSDIENLVEIILRVKASVGVDDKGNDETLLYYNYDYSTDGVNFQKEGNVKDWVGNIKYVPEEGKEYVQIFINKSQIGGDNLKKVRVGIFMKTNDTTSETETGGLKFVGKTPCLYAIQLIAVYKTEFSDTQISTDLRNITIKRDFITSNESNNLNFMLDLIKEYKLEITTDTFTPYIPVKTENIDNAIKVIPDKLGSDLSAKIYLEEGGEKGDVLSAPIVEDWSEYANVLYGYGAGSDIDTYFIKVLDSEQTKEYGEVYGTYTNTNLSVYEDLEKELKDEFEKRKIPKYDFEVRVPLYSIEGIPYLVGSNQYVYYNLNLGDKIRYVSLIRGIDGVFRIIEITESSSGTATLKLESKGFNLINTILEAIQAQRGVPPPPSNFTAEGGTYY